MDGLIRSLFFDSRKTKYLRLFIYVNFCKHWLYSHSAYLIARTRPVWCSRIFSFECSIFRSGLEIVELLNKHPFGVLKAKSILAAAVCRLGRWANNSERERHCFSVWQSPI